MVVSFMFSLGFYIGIIFGFDHSLESPFYCMAFVSSGMLFVMGLIPGKIPQAYFSQKERILMEEIQAKPDLSMSTRVMRRFSLSLTWITTTFYVLLTAFLYQKFTDVGDRVLTIMSFLECLLIGFSIVLIANMNPKISRALKWIATAVMPIAVWRLAVQGLSGTLEPFSVEAGIAFSFAIWVYMSRAAKFSKVKLAGAWIVLTLLVSAYLAFIPSKAPEIERIASQVDVYLTVVVAIDIVSILLIKNVPEIFDHRNYILLVPDEAKKPAVIDVILERVKKFLDLTLTKLDPRSDEKGDTPRERTIEYKGKEENAESGSEEAKNTNETPKGGEYTKEEI